MGKYPRRHHPYLRRRCTDGVAGCRALGRQSRDGDPHIIVMISPAAPKDGRSASLCRYPAAAPRRAGGAVRSAPFGRRSTNAHEARRVRVFEAPGYTAARMLSAIAAPQGRTIWAGARPVTVLAAWKNALTAADVVKPGLRCVDARRGGRWRNSGRPRGPGTSEIPSIPRKLGISSIRRALSLQPCARHIRHESPRTGLAAPQPPYPPTPHLHLGSFRLVWRRGASTDRTIREWPAE
jgi:hypothetical protein